MKKTPHRATQIQTLARHRKLKPAKGMGRVQRACRRALIVHDGVVSTSEAINWAFGQRLLMDGTKRGDSFNFAVRRALETLGARKVERIKGQRGWPYLWELSV
jgi:hypothetical protein